MCGATKNCKKKNRVIVSTPSLTDISLEENDEIENKWIIDHLDILNLFHLDDYRNTHLPSRRGEVQIIAFLLSRISWIVNIFIYY